MGLLQLVRFESKEKEKKSLFTRFFDYWFPTEQKLMENYFSQATDNADLERRQKIWEEKHRWEEKNRTNKDYGALY